MIHYDSMQGLRTIPIERRDSIPDSRQGKHVCKVCGGRFRHDLDFDVRLGMCTACRHEIYERHRRELEAGADD